MAEMDELIESHLLPLLNAIDAADNLYYYRDGTFFLKNLRRHMARAALLSLMVYLKKMDTIRAATVIETFHRLHA